MKNLITLFFIISLTSYSQDKIQQVEVVKTDTQIEEFSKQIGTKEFKLDFLDLLVFPALSVGYEKINDSSTAFGTTLFINLGGEDSDWNDNLAITPYYRFYFLQSEDYGGYGVFAEVFTKFAFGDAEIYNLTSSTYNKENYFDIALGLAVGRKWINRKGFTLETLLGVGRNLFFDEESDSSDRTAASARLNISIGKRF
ncbi:hypothetical protein N9R45_02110 [Flavobacteriaceae bacterium]|nr:hypothetical protein [Flavobacteriaceae bacterium]MDA9572930.1 hypothetical protein [Flavobacteriaceae bacterium]MDB4134126.1 hypothetical protein [Flavobacteriaceae bacterium]MDB4179970.1 hypothetical protein [Flavobacteriaceae bacterium]MDB4196273.1 hypothetical protein [Flavobacteriaceae bacterium]